MLENLLLFTMVLLVLFAVAVAAAIRYRRRAHQLAEAALAPADMLAELRAEKDLLRAEHAVALRAVELERDALRGHLHEGGAPAGGAEGAWQAAAPPRRPAGLGGSLDRVTWLEDELAEAKARLTAQEAVTQLKVEEIESLRGDLQAKAEETARAARRAEDRGEAVRRAEERIALLRMEIEAARASEVEGDFPHADTALKEQIAELRRGLDAERARAGELEAENVRLRSALANAAKAHAEAAGEELAQLRHESERLRAENAELARAAGGRAEADRENAMALRARIEDLAAGIVAAAAKGDREIGARVDAALAQPELSPAAVGAPAPDAPGLAARIRERRAGGD